jgi:C4-dicarboxylate-specific signal transduction histidine kinase
MRKELDLNRSSRRTSATKRAASRRPRKAPATRVPPAPIANPVNAQTQRLASLGFMLASVCHEVSNPLAAISSMVQILQSKRGVTPETVEKGLASIASNIARVLAITKKLGDFSRVTGDAPAPVAIDDAVDAAAALLRHSPCGRGVGVDYAGAPGAAVLARPGELQQVMFNIFLNAAQAMQGAGRIEARARTDGARIAVSIRDGGPGIPAAHLARVFDPFFTTKQPGEGTGLGLAISYEIVHELGGTVCASNHPGGGACFQVQLPACRT